MRTTSWRRRDFLGAASVLTAGALGRPATVAARSDEPQWNSLLTVTVGPHKADLVGADEKAIQGAVEYAARWGGGTVRILPGTYRLRNAVFLRPRVRILGSGLDSVLLKSPSVKTTLTEDCDFYEREIALADASGFQVGDGVCLRARSQRHGKTDVFTRTLVARDGKRFRLDRPLPGYPEYVDLWVEGGATATTLFALISGDNFTDAAVENIALDGNKANNEFLNGNSVGCVHLRDCSRIRIQGVAARNFNGDALVWFGGEDLRVENCHCHDNAGYGMHSGEAETALRSLVRGNRLERNESGFYFCWGVKQSIVEHNVISQNRRFAISIGHNDSGNIIRQNEIRENGEAGIVLREEPGRPPRDNRLEENRIVDNGGGRGIGIDVQGRTEGLLIVRNEIRETRSPMKRIGVRIAAAAKDVQLAGNRIEGFAVETADLRGSNR